MTKLVAATDPVGVVTEADRPDYRQGEMWRIGIIGTAGRKPHGHRMSKRLYGRMVHKTLDIIQTIPRNMREVHSGGAAWADHIAVSLMLMGEIESPGSLHLHIPVPWCTQRVPGLTTAKPKPCYMDDGSINWFQNPGGTLNYYHGLFSNKMGTNTLEGIEKAIVLGAKVHDQYFYQRGDRFKARNLGIGKGLDLLIAFTWAEGDHPADGGTEHCWSHSDATKKIHIPLGTLL